MVTLPSFLRNNHLLIREGSKASAKMLVGAIKSSVRRLMCLSFFSFFHSFTFFLRRSMSVVAYVCVWDLAICYGKGISSLIL